MKTLNKKRETAIQAKPTIGNWGRQRGSITGIVLTAAFFVAVTIIVLQQSGSLFTQVRGEGSTAEITRLILAANNYRTVLRSYADISIARLSERGYDCEDSSVGKFSYLRCYPPSLTQVA